MRTITVIGSSLLRILDRLQQRKNRNRRFPFKNEMTEGVLESPILRTRRYEGGYRRVFLSLTVSTRQKKLCYYISVFRPSI